MSKVAVIGAGNVGATAVYYIAERGIADVVMVDVLPGFPQAKGLDFLHASGLRNYHTRVWGSNDYADIAGADVVVLTAGVARKPGMDRMDLLKVNVEVAKTAAQAIAAYAPDAVVVVVTNPLDVICMVVLRETGFALRKVMGQAGVLDATRYRYFIAQELGVWPGDVNTMVLGGHGDTMVPLISYTTVAGIPITQLLKPDAIERLVDRTRKGGAEIVSLLKTGSAYYAPGASTAKMVESVIKDEKRLIAASVYLRGEYGFDGVFLGVPALVGRGGVERIYEVDLEPSEKAALASSAEAVRAGVRDLETIYQPGPRRA